jgi:uncharacterized membrane protein YdbT with pleckstrin-like domain
MVALVRRHWVVLGFPVGVALFLAGCMAAIWAADRRGLMPILGVAFLVAAVWAIWRFLDWRCDLWAVTSQRVIDEAGVMTVRMVDSPIETILNITCEQSLLGRMLGYGTMDIQTAAKHGLVRIEHVHAPDELRALIMDLRKNQIQRGGAKVVNAEQEDGAELPKPTVPTTSGTGPETKECPFCAEWIKAKAKVCRFCGRDVA